MEKSPGAGHGDWWLGKAEFFEGRKRMKIGVPYGTSEIEFECRDEGELAAHLPKEDLEMVVRKPPDTSLPLGDDARGAAHVIERSLDNPLGGGIESLRGAKRVAIIVSDHTRPGYSRGFLQGILPRLSKAGVRDRGITVVVGCGSHRPPTPDELERIAGPALRRGLKIIVHDSSSPDNVFIGKSSRGTPFVINREVALADARVVTGIVEPHQMAGFSGGAKSVTIGVGGVSTIEANHLLMLDPRCGPGKLDGNPLREDIEEVRDYLAIDFLINGACTKASGMLKAASGTDYDAVYGELVGFSSEYSRAEYTRAADVAIVSPGGYPKDIDLYQSQKALLHSEPVVRLGGVVILVAECSSGIGNSAFEEWMRSARKPEDVIERMKAEGFRLGAHKAVLLCRTLTRNPVILVSRLDPDVVRSMMMEPAPSLEAAVKMARDRMGPGQKWSVVTEGSSILPERSN